jgi:hypothetical protein
MPAAKILKNSEQYYEVKAKYEAGDTLDEIIVFYKKKYDIDITRRTIERFSVDGKWQKGRLKDLYDAKKLVKTQDILNQFKPDVERKGLDILETEAERQAKENAEREIRLKEQELIRREKQQKAKDYGTDLLLDIMETLKNIVTSGEESDNATETFEYDNRGKLETKNIISKASKYKIMKDAGLIDILKGIGTLNPTPTVAIQNNQTNNQGGEVKPKTTKEPLIIFEPHYAENKD